MIYQLENPIQPYTWGSASLLPRFLGRPNPGQEPWAELWMGAHPRAPSLAGTGGGGIPLDRLLAGNPHALLGTETIEHFGPALPFLFKILAIENPLSIQCHPGAEQAREGFRRENRLGIPLDAPERNYRDPHHKPEIILALSDFTALRGLRRVEEIAAFFSALPVRELQEAGGDLATAPDPAQGLQVFLRTLLTAPEKTSEAWIRSCLRGPLPGDSPDPRPEASWFRRLAARYPADVGCFAPFYLNLVRLRPGEALALKAGELHAYLEGLGVELMANSDNVLRGGLTPKHRDTEELLRILDYRSSGAEILRPRKEARGGGFFEEEYPSPAEEFVLSVLRGLEEAAGQETQPRTRIDSPGPEILLCGAGDGEIRGRENSLVLRKGEAVFVPADEKTYLLSGACEIYRARVPL